jgi:hypothetical protein
MARDEEGDTLLHDAALFIRCKPGKIEALLTAGAAGKAKNKEGKTPWDFAEDNEDLKGTKGYRALSDAQYD